MNTDLSGLNYVITGGTGALGSAVVGQLLDAGAVCHIPTVDPKELERFPHRNQCQIAERIELTDEAAVESFYARFDGPSAPRLWASIHIAGGFAMSSVEATSKADFVKLMQTNALTCFLCSREAVKRMKRAAPGPSGGRIVNVAARPGLIPELGSGMVPYTTSKAAVAAMTQAMAAEVADSGILVNAVVPSIMDTRVNREAMPNADHSKWPKVSDVAATICFLASPSNTSTRGGLVPVYGRS